MTIMSATEVKNKFGKVIDQAKRGPVIVQTHGRSTVVILDCAEYERLQQLEDAYWGARADEAKESGFLSPADTMAELTELLKQADDRR